MQINYLHKFYGSFVFTTGTRFKMREKTIMNIAFR